MGRSSVAPVQAPPVAELAAHPEWAQEFLEHEQFVQVVMNRIYFLVKRDETS